MKLRMLFVFIILHGFSTLALANKGGGGQCPADAYAYRADENNYTEHLKFAVGLRKDGIHCRITAVGEEGQFKVLTVHTAMGDDTYIALEDPTDIYQVGMDATLFP